eukprot:EG_transcript_25141
MKWLCAGTAEANPIEIGMWWCAVVSMGAVPVGTRHAERRLCTTPGDAMPVVAGRLGAGAGGGALWQRATVGLAWAARTGDHHTPRHPEAQDRGASVQQVGMVASGTERRAGAFGINKNEVGKNYCPGWEKVKGEDGEACGGQQTNPLAKAENSAYEMGGGASV